MLSMETRKARVGFITASSAGAVLGLSPFQKPDDCLLKMVKEYHGEFDNIDHFPAIRWGNENEINAKRQYWFETGNAVEEHDFMIWGILGATPDGLVGKRGMLEIKCPYSLREAESPVFKSIYEQQHYFAQVQVQMYVFERDWVDFFQWAPNGYLCERVKFDPAWIAEKQFAFDIFMERYQSAIKDDQFLLGQGRFDDQWAAACDQYKAAEVRLAEAKQDLEACKNELIDLAGDADKVEGCGVTVARVERQGTVDYRKWAADNEYVVPEEYRGEGTTFRKITIKKGK